ncbi:hypothetical protein SSCG_03717 [Streptomyces clavuligerus]|nr:hypothetical protein SSCG_03717 [Streptomyces clavuligerus]
MDPQVTPVSDSLRFPCPASRPTRGPPRPAPPAPLADTPRTAEPEDRQPDKTPEAPDFSGASGLLCTRQDSNLQPSDP